MLFYFFICDDLSFINITQKTLKPSKNVSMPRMDEKKLHAREFRLEGSGGNMRCKLLQKGLLEKQQECSKQLRNLWSILSYLFQKYSLYWYYAVLIFTSKLRDPPANKIIPPLPT